VAPTSHDVARRAGVSQATVSRALREHPGVAAPTRARVREAARALGYVPSAAARSLVTRRTRRVVVVTAGVDDPVHAALIAPLQEALSDHGLQTVLVTADEHPVTADDLLDGSFDGAVLTTCSTTSPVPAALTARGMPCVVADRAVDGDGADTCRADDRAGAAAVADLLVELGHRRIGVIAGPPTTSTGRDRLGGFLDRLGRHGITVGSGGIHTGPFTVENGRRGLVELLAAGPAMPTAVFCGDDVIALGALEAAARYGVAVPDDLAVVGFGGTPSACREPLALTTVDVDLAAMARTAAGMLVERLAGTTAPPRTVVLPARLAAGRTHGSARPPRADLGADRVATEPGQGLRRWMAATSELARAVNSASPTTTVLTLIARRACELIGFDFCAVMLAGAGDEYLSVEGFHGLDDEYVGLVSDEQALQIRPRSSDQDSPAARAFRERRTVAVTDTRSATVYGRLRDLAPAQGYRSLVAAPLRDAGGAVNGLIVGYLQEPHVFTAEELDLTELLGEQIMVVLETDRLRRTQERTIVELSALNEEMREARRQLDWAEEQHERLMQLVLDGAGLEGLTDALAGILEAAISVQGADGEVLAQSAGHALVAASRPGPDHGPGADESWTVPVLVTGEMVGRLWIRRRSSRPDPLERRAVERFALVVGIEIVRRRHLDEVRQRFTRDVLGELLRPGGPVHLQSVLDHASSLGVDLGEPHVLVLVCGPGGGPAPGLLQICRKALGTIERGLVGQYDGDVVAVLPAALDVDRALEPLRSDLGATTERPAPVVVLAPETETPADYAGAYRIARGVARLRLATDSGVPFVDARRLGVAALLLGEGLPSTRLARFAQGLLAPLERAGAARQGELVATLRAWLEHGCSVAATADALTVHPNTVTYRLGRSEKLLGLDLRTFENRLTLQLALTVADVAGRADAGRA
jgi:DNA-binding LacI/PurR family transcriptional regulator/GAF domain-containing protein